MNPALRNTLAVLFGLLIGMLANSGLVSVGPRIIALPPGADVSTPEGLSRSMPLLEPRHFLFPWLAHALGTGIAVFLGCRLAASRQLAIAAGLCALNLVGGIIIAAMVNGPLWFTVVDLSTAYVPFALIGYCLAGCCGKACKLHAPRPVIPPPQS